MNYGESHREGTRRQQKHLGQQQPAERADEGLHGKHEQRHEHKDQVGLAAGLVRNKLGGEPDQDVEEGRQTEAQPG